MGRVTGVQKLIKKMWVKFDDMDVECICNYHERKCTSTEKRKGCKEYVVKFIEVERNELKDDLEGVSKEIKKLDTELRKSINKFRIK